MMISPMVQTGESVTMPPWGQVMVLKIHTADYRRLHWRQVWQAFQDIYPGRWALELYPLAAELVDDAHVYHLWMLPPAWQPPWRMNLANLVRG